MFYFWCLGYFTNNRWLYLNTGLSSSINWGRKLLTEEADIVTAHGKETVKQFFIYLLLFIIIIIYLNSMYTANKFIPFQFVSLAHLSYMP